MKKFNPYNIKDMDAIRGEIVALKKEGLSIREIAEKIKKYAKVPIDDNKLFQKVRWQWRQHTNDLTVVSVENDDKPDLNPESQIKTLGTDLKNPELFNQVDMDELEKNGFVDVPGTCTDVEAKYDSTLLKKFIIVKDGLVTPEVAMRAHNVDPLSWEIIDWKINSWQSQMKGGKLLTLCQSKMRVKPIKGPTMDMWKNSFKQAINKLAESGHTASGVHARNYGTGDDLAICSIADLHLGKLAFKAITGEEYNTQIAEENFNFIVNEYIKQLSTRKVGKIIFYWCQDFFHYDSKANETTKGTKQDTDTAWNLLLLKGGELLAWAIDQLSKVAPVESMYVCSNHDEHTGFAAAYYLYGLFKDREDVTINVTPTTRKYFRWGNGLYGFAHGDKEGKRIQTIMQIEAREAWGLTAYHEWFLGHFHSEHVRDEGGVKIRYLGSPTGTDAWHSQSGYCGAAKEAQLFIRNKQTGPVTDIPIIIPNRNMPRINHPEYEGWVDIAL